MQRVLSFQLARGFGESSEFVTKRMCFSFLFSVGFLSLLCGFLLGRFAAERTIAFRAEKKQLELAGNGLDNTEHLRHLLLRELDEVSLDSDDFTAKGNIIGLREEDRQRINGVMSNLSFVPRVTEHVSSITATIRGSKEPGEFLVFWGIISTVHLLTERNVLCVDRYVVLSASRKGITIALEILKGLSKIHHEYDWKPRRTLVFCLFSGIGDPCIPLFPHLTQRKIVGYIALHSHVLPGPQNINVTATEVPLSIVSEIIRTMSKTFTDCISLSFSRSSDTTIDVPHVIFSLAAENRTYGANDAQTGATITILAQIVEQTIWILSESLFVKWDPNDFNRMGLKILESFNNTLLRDAREKVRDAMDRLVATVEILNKRIDAIDPIMTMDLRIFNDVCMDLARALMCPDRKLQERLHWESLQNLQHESPTNISLYFDELIMCYESAARVLYDW